MKASQGVFSTLLLYMEQVIAPQEAFASVALAQHTSKIVFKHPHM